MRAELYTRSVSAELIELEVIDDLAIPRIVSVRVATGAGSWLDATRFPHEATSSGASTGDEKLDDRIRRRAAEELARLDAARRAAA